jgi:hypothetical protein
MLVWKAMPSITPMMSAIFLELSLISSMVETLGDDGAAALGNLGSRGSELVGLPGRIGRLLDGAGELLDGGCGLSQTGGGLVGSGAQYSASNLAA